MALWRCRRCGTRFAVGLPYCPHCTGTDVEEDTGDMAKNTVHGGASDQLAEPGQPGYQAPAVEVEAEAEAAPVIVVDANAEDDDGGALDELTVAELRSRLRARDLPISGSKDDLRDRLARAELHEDTS